MVQIPFGKVWAKFPKTLLENGDATRHATSFSLGNRYEINVAAFVLDETCPVLRNIPFGQIGPNMSRYCLFMSHLPN